MLISDHVSNLRNWMEFKNYSKQSVNSYCSCFGSFLYYFEKQGVTHPDRINSKQIIEYLSQFKEPSTHSGYHSVIKIYYEKIAHVGIEKFKYIERPRKSKKLPIILSQDEIQKMFDVCDNKKHKIILCLLYSCGLRVSELINLQWSHIDRSRMIINIIQGKGLKDRQVMLDSGIIPKLEDYYREYHSKIYVLNGQFKDQYTQSSVLQVIKQLATKAGIKKRVYTHLIRHCTMSHILDQGTDINLIKELCGHSDVKTTLRYLHISDRLISNIPSPISNIRL